MATLLHKLMAYWKLGEATGSTRLDSHNANHLTPLGGANPGPSQTTGLLGNAAQFTAGNQERLRIANNSSLSTGDIDFTLKAKLYFDTKPADVFAVSKWNSTGNREQGLRYTSAADRLRFDVSSTGADVVPVQANAFGSPPIGQWIHVFVWHDSVANTINIQVNNGTINSASHTLGVFNSTAGFLIGQRDDLLGNYWDGRVDEVGFWKRVLTADERTYLYNGGAGRTYPFTPSGNIQWILSVDWDNDGVFEADEADRLQHVKVSRGRNQLVRDDGEGFEHARVGTGTFTLDNYDGRYDPLLSTSELYPYVLPGREVRLRVSDGASVWDVLRGKMEEPIPMGKRRGGLVKFVVADGWQWLQDRTVKKTLQTSIRTDTALGHILDNADWPSVWGRSLGTGADTLPYWWVDGQRAAAAINELVDSEQGQFYIAGNGQATFIGRQALYNATASLNLTQAEILSEILLPQPWRSVRNIIRVKCYPRVVQASATLWQMQDKPLVNPGASLTIFAEFRYSNRVVPADPVTTPVATTDYTANTAADGSGSDLTANFSMTTFTVFGTTAKIVITNTGAQAGYVTLLKVRGQAVDAPDATLIERDGSSGSAYGPRALTMNLAWQQSVSTATDLADWLKSLLDDALAFPVIQLEARETIQYAYDLFTRINLSASALGISADYYLGKIEHEWLSETGQAVRTTWCLEPADMTAYWKFTTQIGVTSRFAY
jgi:hypothetical protein